MDLDEWIKAQQAACNKFFRARDAEFDLWFAKLKEWVEAKLNADNKQV